ncbi:MAG: hypothetical protein IK047_06175, partial [Clostridia bacterium]|nr:hypothetical protein [Clostridia bacterium]
AVFISYRAFSGHDSDLAYDEITITEKNMKNGVFTAKVKCTKTGYFICGTRSEIKDGALYITLESNIDRTRALEAGEDGCVTVRFETGDPGVKTVYYICAGKTRKLSYEQ